MKFRSFGKLDWKCSALGLGAMRLPTTDGEIGGQNINEAEAIGLIRHAIEQGVNYLDTAYPYHRGKSESLVGKALGDGYRKHARIATKLPTWYIKSAEDFDRYLGEQLGRLQTEHIDFYLFHGLTRALWRDVILKHDLLRKAELAIEDGRISHLGFSFHDEYGAFAEILNGYDRWTFCQIQYNYMDIENQAGRKGLALAAGKGLAVVIMEPLLGGGLANPPQEIRDLFNSVKPKRSPAEWGLQWLWDQPEVSVVLSGMGTMEQVQENLASADRSEPHQLTSPDLQVIEEARRSYSNRTAVPCTNCNYCMPCPNGVDIPSNLEMYNHAHRYDDVQAPRIRYRQYTDAQQRAEACVACHNCEPLCPQKITISEWMPKISALLGEARP